MKKLTVIVALALAAILSGCNKKNVSASSSSDQLEQKLQQLAGNGAQNCGRIKAVNDGQTKPASDCAMQAAKDKKPFYVAYDMPGLSVAVAGSGDGKLYAVQSQSLASAEGEAANQPTGPTELTVTPCPSELRLASSGRVTCFTPGSFGMNASGGSPHGGGMTMPPGMANPHGTMPMPPLGTPNPHGGITPDSTQPTKDGAKPPAKSASKQ